MLKPPHTLDTRQHCQGPDRWQARARRLPGRLSQQGYHKAAGAVQLFSLQDQVQHFTSYLDDFALPRQLPTVIMGHSIGAYIAAQAYQKLSTSGYRSAHDDRIRQVNV